MPDSSPLAPRASGRPSVTIPRDVWAALLPLLGAPVVLGWVAGTGVRLAGWGELLFVALALALASAHRPLGSGTLGLGALALPLLLLRARPASAARRAAGGFVGVEFG